VNLAVIGVGHVGLVTAACLADLGHEVVGLDDDHAKIDTLLAGGVPFHEPDLPQLIEKVTGSGLLRFTTDLGEAIADAEVVFVCVGTPPLPGGGPDLRFVERVAVEVAAQADHELVLVEKSTVPANTGRRLSQVIEREQTARGVDLTRLHIASNPEFLREGAAVYDTLNPDRIVYGTSSDFALDALRRVYAPLVERTGAPVVETDVNTAELIKHASNAFLATKISFINAVANVCDIVGADVEVVAQGMGMDERIGPKFLQAGLGFGGSCLVPDESVLVRRDQEVKHLRMDGLWSEVEVSGLEGLEILAWDPDTNRSSFLPLAAVTLRPYAGEVVEVRTKMGRRLRTTVDHPFVVGDGTSAQTQVKLAGELTRDDWLPLAAGAPVDATTSTPRVEASANVLAAVTSDLITPPEVIHRLSPSGYADVQQRADRLPTPRRYDVLRNGTIRLDELAELELPPSGGTYGTAKNGTYVPDHLPMDGDFWRMIGLFLAEGHISTDGSRERIAWSFHPTGENDLVEFVAGYWTALDVKVAVRRMTTTCQVSISSRLLAGWMEEVLGLGRDCYTKRLPNEVWTAPPAHQRAALRGLWDGDGSWSLVNGGPSVVLEYGTVSQPLADGMLRLLGHLGIVASMRTGRTAKSCVDTYWLRISGADQVESALWLFPDDEADEIRRAVAGQQKRIAPTGYRRLEGDTAWLRVTETRRHDYRGPVYSVEVPGAHTVVSTGGLVTHNCFPKDVDAFLHLSRNVGYDFRLLEEVARINAGQRDAVLGKLRDELWHLSGKTITVLGAAFKPGTDDLRESPALHLARALVDEGATVRIYDPVALDGVRQQMPDLDTFADPIEALAGAHAAVVATDWPEIVKLDLGEVKAALDYPILVDGRNCLDPAAAKAAGLRYHGIGRGHLDV
jgi:UDPglucose 6-dehydrogenase